MEEDTLEYEHMTPPRVFVERTLALIKPDAIGRAIEIEDIILKSGFTILQVINNTLITAVHHIIVIKELIQNKYRIFRICVGLAQTVEWHSKENRL